MRGRKRKSTPLGVPIYYGNLLCGEIFVLISRSRAFFRYISARRNIPPDGGMRTSPSSITAILHRAITARVRFHPAAKKEIGTRKECLSLFW